MRSALLLSTVIALAACQPGQNPFGRGADGTAANADGGATAAPSARSVTLVDRDVEAPEVFQVTDQALWDGRPSLGGVWVASPDATDPERVILRNPANGKFVIGALFKREVFNPGPKLQISSDAAEALGLLAGQPGTLSVTALRREEVAAETDASRPLLDANEPVAASTTASAAANTPASTGAAAASGASAPAAVSVEAIAATAIDEAEAAQPAAPVIADTPAPAATAAAPAAAAPAGGTATVQIGIFSQEANANRAVQTLQKAGLTAAARKETTQGKTWWSVTASGPGTRDALLAKVKDLGFADAYAIRR
ncbi:SPOR domain-containing protein [Tabrizicola sp. TH137]|uniref:SPOR domain-containing protein n=1 Tax=Tabrizicola sp. TH137 TaxID=2067452 RepID=UPI0020B44704|nr:SPOR domain-containing protein [Tabrizicola sp. TH137]